MKFSLILADPPWSFRDRCNAGKRGVVHKYPVLTIEQLKALPVADVADDDCLLAMWWVPTQPMEALALVEAWGFKFMTMKGFTWHKRTKNFKSHIGMGTLTRANTEDCLFAKRGRPKRIDAAVRQFMDELKGEHSRKPRETRWRLERLLGDVPRLELFARERVPGWTSLGLDIDGVPMDQALKELAGREA